MVGSAANRFIIMIHVVSWLLRFQDKVSLAELILIKKFKKLYANDILLFDYMSYLLTDLPNHNQIRFMFNIYNL